MRKFVIRVTESEYRQAKIAAAKDGRTISSYLRIRLGLPGRLPKPEELTVSVAIP